MRNLLSIALCLPLAACVIGEDDPSGGDDGGGDTQNPTDPPADGSLTGIINQDTTWSGTVIIGAYKATTRIDAGTTVTVMPGTIIKFKDGTGQDLGKAGLEIRGTLRVMGTKDAKVVIEPVADNRFGLILGSAPTAGTLELTYAVMSRGNIQTNPGSTATITDSQMYRSSGDLLIMNGGTLNMTYSQIGPVPGAVETTHCNLHTSGNANTITVTNSNINGAPYGLMLYGGQNAIFRNNNWYDNSMADIDTMGSVSADVTGSWFDGAAPTPNNGGTLTGLDALSPTRLTAGVR